MYLETVAPDVELICGFPRYAVNAYLVGNVLVDALTRWERRGLLKALKKRGRSPSLVALTHAHPDHLGAAAAVCQEFSAPLACHAADADVAAGAAPMRPVVWQIAISNQVFGGPPHPVSRLLSEGDDLAGFQVWHAPGHTPGHVVLFREQDGVAIVGDVLFGMQPATLRSGLHAPPSFFCSDAAENRRSMLKVFAARPRQMLFGHGRPQRSGRNWDDFAAEIQSQIDKESSRPEGREGA